MRLVFAGTPQAAIPSLQALLASDRHEVVAVVTRPDATAGRGRKISISPVKQLAVDAGIEVLQPPAARANPTFQASLRGTGAGLLLRSLRTVRWCRGRRWTIPRYGWVNLHFSVLPAWRGVARLRCSTRCSPATR